MNKPFRVLIAAALFVSLSGLALAQEGKDLDAFLEDDSPALLFGIYDVSLRNWQGGIGMMFSSAEDFHWRFSFSPNVASDEVDPPDTSQLAQSSDFTSVGVTAAPFWVLSTSERMALTGGPSLGYRYEVQKWWMEGNWRRPETENTSTEHSISVGADFGVLYALTDAIAVHAEYRLQWNYTINRQEDYSQVEKDRTQWNLFSFAAFSMVIRL